MCEMCISYGLVMTGWEHRHTLLGFVHLGLHAPTQDEAGPVGGPRRVNHEVGAEPERPGFRGAQFGGPEAVGTGFSAGLGVVDDGIDHALPRFSAPERVPTALGADFGVLESDNRGAGGR